MTPVLPELPTAMGCLWKTRQNRGVQHGPLAAALGQGGKLSAMPCREGALILLHLLRPP